MNALSRWDPFKELEELHNRLASIFGHAPVRHQPAREESITVAEWTPLVDVIEDENEYVIKAELAGLTKDDVKVTVEGGTLTISGERKIEKEEKGKRFHRVERAYGSFMRSFALPDDADPAGVTAEFKDGVLKVRLPKTKVAKPRQIEVKIS